jgi:hypothetical protein
MSLVSRLSHAFLPECHSRLTAFATKLATRFEAPRDSTLADELFYQTRMLPLPPSSTVTAKREELDRLGTELWNLSTRLRREDPQSNGKSQEDLARRNRSIVLLRVFSFLLLDSAGGQGTKGRERKTCIRLMKVALKAAKVCIEGDELDSAVKVLERAADYQEALTQGVDAEDLHEAELGDRLRMEYFAVRTTLVSCLSPLITSEIGYERTNMWSTGMASRSNGHRREHVHKVQTAHMLPHTFYCGKSH